MAITVVSCSKEFRTTEEAEISIRFKGDIFATKAYDPDENLVKDASIMIFDEYGRLEESCWIGNNAASGCAVSLLQGKKYRFVACVNFGYRISVSDNNELEDIFFYMTYPDEYREGMPMMADSGLISISKGEVIELNLIRLMSKISIRMDRSRLSEDVEMSVKAVRIGNCPKRVHVFGKSRIESPDDRFNLGFTRNDSECGPLNSLSEHKGISKEIVLYMLENMQGKFSEQTIDTDADKVFDKDDIRKDICSYVELDIEYLSDSRFSNDKPLKYRFYLGDDRNSLDIERNHHYRITVCPEDDGLKEDGWRVDKSGISDIAEGTLIQYPESYIRGNIGDKIHIGCKLTPAHAPFDVGLEYLEDDKATGIYDYEIDPDGHGVVLTLTGPGRGMIYMSAGEPINDSALWIIEVNLPTD